MSKSVVVEADSRRRVGLGKLGRHDRYLAIEQPDGTITFEPAVILPEAERAWLETSNCGNASKITVRTRNGGGHGLPVPRPENRCGRGDPMGPTELSHDDAPRQSLHG